MSLNKPLFVAAAVAICHLPPALAAQPLADLLRTASRDGSFSPPETDELERARRLFAAILAGQSPETLQREAAALDLEIVRTAEPDALVVIEKAGARRGRGLFAFREGDGDTLEVPHSFKDEMTREIGLALFAEGRFAAAVWNTVPRYAEFGGNRVNTDMAHLDATYFMAFTQAVAARRPQRNILQIHGFDQRKRKNAEAREADLILSAGHRNPPEELRRHQRCLNGGAAWKTALYPESSPELGGTTNAQAGWLLSNGFDRFIHAEMSRPLRETLRQDGAARRQLLDCLQGRP